MKRVRRIDPAQIDLFEWAERRPRAKILNAIPAIAKRMWREIHQAQPTYPPHVVPLRRRA